MKIKIYDTKTQGKESEQKEMGGRDRGEKESNKHVHVQSGGMILFIFFTWSVTVLVSVPSSEMNC